MWDEPTLNERRADSAVPATASSGGATVLTKAELPVMASGHELGVVNSAVYAGGSKVAHARRRMPRRFGNGKR